MTNIPEPEHPIVPLPVLRRLPFYYSYLIEQAEEGLISISSSQIADDLNLHPVQVRKDLAMTKVSGRPRTGFNVQALIDRLRDMLGYNDMKSAIIIGAGKLGSALIGYRGFEGFGLRFVAAFDTDDERVGQKIEHVEILSMKDIESYIQEHKIQIAVLTVPAVVAQDICDRLVNTGMIKAVWNFAPKHLQVPKGVILQNENIAASLSVLSKRMMDQEYLEAHGLDEEPERQDRGPRTRF